MAYMDTLMTSISDPILGIVNSVVAILPGVVAALIILLVGYLIGWAVSVLLRRVFHEIKFDTWLVKKTGLGRSAGDFAFGDTLST